MLESGKPVLIGDADPDRFGLLKDIFDEVFLVESVRVESFDELKDKLAKTEFRLVLVADVLPESPYTRSIPPTPIRYFMQLDSIPFGGVIGCLVTRQQNPVLTGVTNRPVHIHIPVISPTEEQRKEIITELKTFGDVLPLVHYPPKLTLVEADAILREQVRGLSENRDLKEGEKQLAHLIRRFFNWDEVEVAKLGQGQSGAKVFCVRRMKDGSAQKEVVLKLSSRKELWKIKLEINGQKSAKALLAPSGYRKYVAKLKKPLFPLEAGEEQLKYVVSYNQWYAICYDYLGGKKFAIADSFGKFIDLETALIASADELLERTKGTGFAPQSPSNSHIFQARLKIMKTMLRWLNQNWYRKQGHVKREVRQVWNTRANPERQYDSVPPYKLAGRTKGFILSFLDSPASNLGKRLFPNWDVMHDRVRRLVEISEGLTGLKRLDAFSPVVLSPTHGDLNSNNILLWLDQADHPFLIDFPFFQTSGHALQDFARLEVEIKFALMDRQHDSPANHLPAFDHTPSQVALWQAMEDYLLSEEWSIEKRTWPKKGFKDNVAMTLSMVQLLRKEARDVQQQALEGPMPEDFNDEYFPALLYHTLRAIGYPSFSIFKRLLAVYSASSMLSRL